jgi:hypothetical protein
MNRADLVRKLKITDRFVKRCMDAGLKEGQPLCCVLFRAMFWDRLHNLRDDHQKRKGAALAAAIEPIILEYQQAMSAAPFAPYVQCPACLLRVAEERNDA